MIIPLLILNLLFLNHREDTERARQREKQKRADTKPATQRKTDANTGNRHHEERDEETDRQ